MIQGPQPKLRWTSLEKALIDRKNIAAGRKIEHALRPGDSGYDIAEIECAIIFMKDPVEIK